MIKKPMRRGAGTQGEAGGDCKAQEQLKGCSDHRMVLRSLEKQGGFTAHYAGVRSIDCGLFRALSTEYHGIELWREEEHNKKCLIFKDQAHMKKSSKATKRPAWICKQLLDKLAKGKPTGVETRTNRLTRIRATRIWLGKLKPY